MAVTVLFLAGERARVALLGRQRSQRWQPPSIYEGCFFSSFLQNILENTMFWKNIRYLAQTSYILQMNIFHDMLICNISLVPITMRGALVHRKIGPLASRRGAWPSDSTPGCSKWFPLQHLLRTSRPLAPSPILPSITFLHPCFIRNFPALKSEQGMVQFVSRAPLLCLRKTILYTIKTGNFVIENI